MAEGRGDDWPIQLFELRDQQLVELCDVFEAAFERPARFSFRRHGDRLNRILDRFDRFAGRGENSRGTGFREAVRLIEATGHEAVREGPTRRGVVVSGFDGRRGRERYSEIATLAYFIPVLDEMSKDRRRHWRRYRDPDRPAVGQDDATNR